MCDMPDDRNRGLSSIADSLLAAYDNASLLPPISSHTPGFSQQEGYAVLERIAATRVARGWRAIGRKIGFTNTTIWERYGVDRPMWAHTWSNTVTLTTDGTASLALEGLVQPRIE